jgi:hypothetical protein
VPASLAQYYLSNREGLALLICGLVVFMLMLAIPYIFGWWWRRK